MIDKSFIDVLCCPKRTCRGDLELINENNEDALKCCDCRDIYPIVKGIPVLFPNVSFAPEFNKASFCDKASTKNSIENSDCKDCRNISSLDVIKKISANINLAEKVVIDSCCVDSRLLGNFPDAGCRIGIGDAFEPLCYTKEKEPDLWLVCGQAEDMPFKDAVADFLVRMCSLYGSYAPEQVISEMTRVVKPSGHMYLDFSNSLKTAFRCVKAKLLGRGFRSYCCYSDIKKMASDNFAIPVDIPEYGWVRRCLAKIRGKVCFLGSIQAVRHFGVLEKLCYKLQTIKRRKKEHSAMAYSKLLQARNYCYLGTDQQHMFAAIKWIKKAQDATPDSGVSRAFAISNHNTANIHGWQPSYPETTGYIIPTMIRAAKFMNNDDLLRRAKLMADWELAIMYPDGAVHGGNISMQPNMAIFDTGQVLRGLLAIYDSTKDKKYLDAAHKSAKWMLSCEQNQKGYWVENNASCVDSSITTYNIYAIAPLAELAFILESQQLKDLGLRVADYTLSKQNNAGWFDGADFYSKNGALLHTIAYTFDGLYDCGMLYNRQDYKDAAKKAVDGVISSLNDKGFVPGRFDDKWKGSVEWACLTGMAQTAITCLKLFKSLNEESYLQAALKLKEAVKSTQNMLDDKRGGIGAVWGSWPIEGEYGRFQALNWAVKYLADLLLDFADLEHQQI